MTARHKNQANPERAPQPEPQPQTDEQPQAPETAPQGQAPPEQAAGEEVSTTTGESQAAAVEAELEELRGQLAEAHQRSMRWQAELENYRKRVARQLEEERRYASMDLLRDLLPIIDNLHRAADAAEQNHDIESLLSGLRMILKQIEDTLACHHCTQIDALGQPFDPNRHEAISRQPAEDCPANTVTCVTQQGYMLHDRVVRPSQVVVSYVPETAQTPPGDQSGSEPAASEHAPDDGKPKDGDASAG